MAFHALDLTILLEYSFVWEFQRAGFFLVSHFKSSAVNLVLSFLVQISFLLTELSISHHLVIHHPLCLGFVTLHFVIHHPQCLGFVTLHSPNLPTSTQRARSLQRTQTPHFTVQDTVLRLLLNGLE